MNRMAQVTSMLVRKQEIGNTLQTYKLAESKILIVIILAIVKKMMENKHNKIQLKTK